MKSMAQAKEDERAFLLDVIQAYRELPCLWKVKSDDYSNRNQKNEAYEILLTEYQERYQDATKDDLKKRLNALRTNFRKELKKVNDSAKSGSDDVYKSNLWYFDAMLFLSDQEVPLQSKSTIVVETQLLNDQEWIKSESEPCRAHEEAPKPTGSTPTTAKGTAKTSKRRQLETNEKRDELICLPCKRLQQSDDYYLTLAKTWANEISKMDSRQQLFAKKAINDIIFEGQCGTLHRHSVQINITPTPSQSSTSFSNNVQ